MIDQNIRCAPCPGDVSITHYRLPCSSKSCSGCMDELHQTELFETMTPVHYHRKCIAFMPQLHLTRSAAQNLANSPLCSSKLICRSRSLQLFVCPIDQCSPVLRLDHSAPASCQGDGMSGGSNSVVEHHPTLAVPKGYLQSARICPSSL